VFLQDYLQRNNVVKDKTLVGDHLAFHAARFIKELGEKESVGGARVGCVFVMSCAIVRIASHIYMNDNV
jgi:hypothetical protein